MNIPSANDPIEDYEDGRHYADVSLLRCSRCDRGGSIARLKKLVA